MFDPLFYNAEFSTLPRFRTLYPAKLLRCDLKSCIAELVFCIVLTVCGVHHIFITKTGHHVIYQQAWIIWRSCEHLIIDM